MSLINCIRKNYHYAIVSGCSDKRCKLNLSDLKNFLVLKGEKLRGYQKISDCIIFIVKSTVIIGIVELKGKTVHVGDIINKLSNASKIALGILQRCDPKNKKYNFYHIVLAEKWHSSAYRVVTTRKIEVRGEKYNIIPKECGIHFSNIISLKR